MLIAESKIASIKEQYPDIPNEYLSFLNTYGSGETPNGFYFYNEPVSRDEGLNAHWWNEFEHLDLPDNYVVLGRDNHFNDIVYCFSIKRYAIISWLDTVLETESLDRLVGVNLK